MRLYPYVRLLHQSWRLLAACLIAALALAALLTLLMPAVYEGRAQLFLSTTGRGDANSLAAGNSFVQEQARSYADVMSTPLVLQPVIDELAIEESAEEMGERVGVTIPPGTTLINLTVSHEDPFAAAAWANGVAYGFTEALEQLERSDEFSASPIRATVVREATPMDRPSYPQPIRTMTLGAALGLLLGLGLAVRKERLGTSVTTEDDVRQVSTAPVLGTVGFDADAQDDQLVLHNDSYGARAESFRTLRTNLRFLGTGEAPRSIVFTSAQRGEGKTATASNLALMMAAAGSSVCLVEGDMRQPGLLEFLSLPEGPGLTDVLLGQVEVKAALQPFGESLMVLGAGRPPPNPSELLGSEPMHTLLRRLEAQFDYVLVDSPALLSVTDAAILARQAGGALVVIWAGALRRASLASSVAALDSAGADLLGFVLNQAQVSSARAENHYHDVYRPVPTKVPG